ncbi:hypothetical protein D3C71_2065570 [compost metagenome]
MIEIGEEMEDLFIPFMAFFHQPKESEQVLKDLQEFSPNKSFDVAVYSLIANFNKN